MGILSESCEPGWTQMQKKCYKFEEFGIGVNWDTADTRCKAINANIASIASICEQKTVAELVKNTEAWIGASDKADEGTWVWSSGTEFYKSGAAVPGMYTNLAVGFQKDGQDNQDCVLMKTDGTWDDIICSKFYNYVCEKAAYAGAATYVAPSTAAATTVSKSQKTHNNEN